MTLDKAIVTLPSLWAIPQKPLTKGQLDALRLGIEALKAVKGYRLGLIHWPHYFLLGETEE